MPLMHRILLGVAWRSVISGLVFAWGYQLALGLRWAAGHALYSFGAAACVGAIIALVIRHGNGLTTFVTTLCGLLAAAGFHFLIGRMGIPWRVLVHFDPCMADIGRTTINERLTIGFITLGFLAISFAAFLAALGFKAWFTNEKPPLSAGHE